MALSMDEQRILDGMERKLADDDPRLASRLAAFGEPRFGSGKARAITVVMSLALAAVVTLMVYTMRPFPVGHGTPSHPAQGARVSAGPGLRAGGSVVSRRAALLGRVSGATRGPA